MTDTQPSLPQIPPTQYAPQPIPPPPPSRKPAIRNYLLAIAAIILVASAFGIARNVLSHQPTVTTPTPDTLATANASSTASALENTQLTQQAAQLTADAMTPTAPPVTYTPSTDIGSTQTSGPWSITVNSIKVVVSDNQFEVPKAGNEFILVNFTALNTDSSAHDMNPYYFTLRDGSGTSYDFTGLTVAKNPDGTVVGGQRLRGDLSYEIPKSLHSVTLQFDSPEDADHSQVVQWNLTV